MVLIKKVVILIPCYNEEEGIGIVMDLIPKSKLNELGYEAEVLVIDNLSRGFQELVNPKAKFYKVDVTNLEALGRVFKKARPG